MEGHCWNSIDILPLLFDEFIPPSDFYCIYWHSVLTYSLWRRKWWLLNTIPLGDILFELILRNQWCDCWWLFRLTMTVLTSDGIPDDPTVKAYWQCSSFSIRFWLVMTLTTLHILCWGIPSAYDSVNRYWWHYSHSCCVIDGGHSRKGIVLLLLLTCWPAGKYIDSCWPMTDLILHYVTGSPRPVQIVGIDEIDYSVPTITVYWYILGTIHWWYLTSRPVGEYSMTSILRPLSDHLLLTDRRAYYNVRYSNTYIPWWYDWKFDDTPLCGEPKAWRHSPFYRLHWPVMTSRYIGDYERTSHSPFVVIPFLRYSTVPDYNCGPTILSTVFIR